MSYLELNSFEQGTKHSVKVSGPEGFRLIRWSHDRFVRALPPGWEGDQDLRNLLLKGESLPADSQAVSDALHQNIIRCVQIDTGWRQMGLNSIAANFVLDTADEDDVSRLIVRVSGQADRYPFVEGENRAWLASLIGRGRAKGMLRANMGWEGAIRFLRATDQVEVVLSAPNFGGFPAHEIAHDNRLWVPKVEDEEAIEEVWADLPLAQQWQLCVRALREINESGDTIELKPERWGEFRFTGGRIDAQELVQQGRIRFIHDQDAEAA